MLPILRSALLLALLPASLAAQGPFEEGDLLVLVANSSGSGGLWRVDPTTGDGSLVLTDQYLGYSDGGWMAFDSHRGGVLAYTAIPAFGTFTPQLWLARHDAELASLGLHDADLRCLAPTGDGRVYLLANGVLSLLDASNQLAPVLDVAAQPVTIELEHLLFDAGTNALIGITRRSNVTVPCATPGAITVQKLPLDGPGTALSGPPTCVARASYSSHPIGLDRLPNGSLIATFADHDQFQSTEMLVIDPATLAITVGATTSLTDVDGIAWCPPLGRVVLLDDGSNELRTFLPGGSGPGATLPANVAVGSSSTGVSSRNSFDDVNLLGPLCSGFVQTYGVGLAGLLGRIPQLGAATCPSTGDTLVLSVWWGRANASCFVGFSPAAASIPALGGTLLADLPFLVTRATALDAQGFGTVSLALPPDPAYVGVPFFAQAAIQDAAAPKGWALTAGLELHAQ